MDCYSAMDFDELVLKKWFAEESLCMAAEVYFSRSKVELRRRAVRYIAYAMNKMEGQGFAGVVPYFAMIYFDRFLSKKDLPHDMGEGFCRRKIKSMELQILQALDWRMNAVTAFCFLDYLFRARNFHRITGGCKRLSVNRIVIQSQADIRVTRFKPSVIAASSLLIATSVIDDEEEFSVFLEKLAASNQIKKEDVLACMKELHSACTKTRTITKAFDDWIQCSSGRAPLPPPQRVVKTDIEDPSQEVENRSELISATELVILRFEVCRWAGDDTGEDLKAKLDYLDSIDSVFKLGV